jgi:hypothetical protein
MVLPRAVLVAVGLTTVITLGACGDDEPSQDAARRQVCDQADAARHAVADLRNVDLSDVSVDDLEAAGDKVSDAVDHLGDAADALGAAGFDEVKSSVDALITAIGDLNTDEPVSDQAQLLVTDARAVADSWRTFVAGVQCD